MIFFCYQKNVYDAFCLYIMIYRANNNNALWMLAFIWYCKCLCACVRVCVREGVHYCVRVGWPVITISFSVYILLLSVKLQHAAYWKHTTPGQSVSERHRRGLFLLLCSSSAEIPINLLYHLIYTFVLSGSAQQVYWTITQHCFSLCCSGFCVCARFHVGTHL